MKSEAIRRSGAPADVNIYFTDAQGIRFPILSEYGAIFSGLFLSPPARPRFEFVTVNATRPLGYGYRFGYNRKHNILVIHRPLVDSVEAIGL